jgi:glycosyltransferase involved in cell wall biosynthesis
VKLTLPRCPLIWSIRCTDVPAGNKFTYLVMKCCAYLSSFVPERISCVAAASRINHISYGYDPLKLVTIPNGYNFECLQFSAEDRESIRMSLGLSSELVIGAVGRYHSDKGQDILIEALKQHKASLWKLILVGRHCDSTNRELQSLIKQAGLTDRIILAGEQSNVSAWLSAFDAFVMPSRTEGFPNALAEAMAVGLSCIATNVGDSALLADNTAILCEPNSNSLTQALAHLFRMDNSARRTLGSLANARVHSEYSMEKAADNYDKLYCELVK